MGESSSIVPEESLSRKLYTYSTSYLQESVFILTKAVKTTKKNITRQLEPSNLVLTLILCAYLVDIKLAKIPGTVFTMEETDMKFCCSIVLWFRS